MIRSRVVATAGHVDHGKSTLVHALTGSDPDRWAEEKRRGMTIDLGFASVTLPGGTEVSFVDVPGHVRFLKNMLAGVGSVDACLFVVDAVEGWKPQSEEHLRILDLLGVATGVVAVTKADRAGAPAVQQCSAAIADRVAGTFLADARRVAVDAVTGTGLDDLRDALRDALAASTASNDASRPRLWVDRSFAVAGAGTVVTGTLTGGSLRVGDDVEVGSAARARIRALEVHGHGLDVAGPGRRVAINLGGVAARAVRRGDAVVRPGQWHRTSVIDARVTVLGEAAALERRGAFLAYVGSGEHAVRLRVIGADSIAPAATGLARMWLPVALPLLPGDRFVLRDSGRGTTAAGGEILDVDPVLPLRAARPDRTLARVVAERGWVEADLLERLTGERVAPTIGRWVVDAETLAAARAELAADVRAAGPAGLDVAALDDRRRALLATLDGTQVRAGRAVPVDAPDPLRDHPYPAALAAAPFSPPSPAEAGADPADVRALVRRGAIVERDGVYFAPEAVEAAGAAVATLLARQPGGVTVSEIRATLGTSRKYVLPLLAHLDAAGVTRRRGDLRIAGPRLPPGAAAPGSPG